MATATKSDGDIDILRAVVDPDAPTFTPSVARALLSLGFNERQRKEISRLLDKNNAGTISERQRQRLEEYVRVGNFLNLMHAKAHVSLAQRSTRR